MAVYYLRSTDGVDTPGGTTWATAFATLQYAATQMAAGDTLWVSQNHVDSQTGQFTVTFPGTITNPNFILCGNDSSEPPTVLATTATVGSSTIATFLTLTGYMYVFGIIFQTRRFLQGSDSGITYEDCVIHIGYAGVGFIFIGASSADHAMRLINSDVTFNSDGDEFQPFAGCFFSMLGGAVNASLLTGANSLINLGSRGFHFHFKDVDLSSLATSIYAPLGTTESVIAINLERCKLHASLTVLASPLVSELESVKLHSCSSANTTYEVHEELYSGPIIEDTGIYRTAGASDGTTNVSWAMSVLASKAFTFSNHLVSPPIVGWTDSTTSKTFTVEIARDGSATPLNDDEIWLELEYPGTTAQGLIASDRVTDFVTTPTAQTSSVEAWTGLGGTNVKQKLSVTVTPGKAGPITARVHIATAGVVTVYVDPKLTEV